MPGLPDPAETMEVGVADVARWMQLPDDQRPRLVDCRERDEFDYCRINGCEWIPLGSIPQSLGRFEGGDDRGIIVYCHHGMRSLHATAFLRGRGVENVFSMAGGIELWSREVDPAVARY